MAPIILAEKQLGYWLNQDKNLKIKERGYPVLQDSLFFIYGFFMNKIKPKIEMDKSPMAENIIVMSRIFLPAQSISRNLWNIAKE